MSNMFLVTDNLNGFGLKVRVCTNTIGFKTPPIFHSKIMENHLTSSEGRSVKLLGQFNLVFINQFHQIYIIT